MDISKFEEAVARYIERMKTVVATGASKFQGKTPAVAVRDVATKAMLGLTNRGDQMPDGGAGWTLNVFRDLSPKGARVTIEGHLDDNFSPLTKDTQAYGYSGGGFVGGGLVIDAQVVEDQASLDAAKNAETSWAQIFNEWTAISRGNWRNSNPTKAEVGLSNNAIPAERASFTYLEDENAVSSSSDSLSMVGFVSPGVYEDFTFEVKLRSVSTWQNDPVGLVIGYVVDENGDAHTLDLMYNPRAFSGPNGMNRVLNLYTNCNTDQQALIASTSQGLISAWGQDATQPPSTAGDMGKTDWNANPWLNAPNGVMVKVVKSGPNYTVDVSRYNESAYVPEAQIKFNVNDFSHAEKFAGPVAIGYSAISQDHVRWDTIESPTLRSPIFNMVGGANEKLEWNPDTSNWEVTGTLDDIPPNRILRNPYSGLVYYRSTQGLHQIGGVSR